MTDYGVEMNFMIACRNNNLHLYTYIFNVMYTNESCPIFHDCQCAVVLVY